MKLTGTETRMLRLLAMGATRFYVAERMGTSVSGTARILNNLYDRTGACNTVELLCFLIVTGVLEIDPKDFPHCAIRPGDGAPYRLSETKRAAALELDSLRKLGLR
jgi:DNA-binding CsgD family transcriptional regulator